MVRLCQLGHSRLVTNPTAFPRATGRRMAAAGLLKTPAGRVMDGMYVVILTDSRRFIVK
jgi:hypothetical protein